MATLYDADNTKERERMPGLVEQLDDDQSRRAANAEWSVADVLGHLAFWDARVVYFVERWLDDLAHNTIERSGIQHARIGNRAHATRVRPGIVLADAFVIARGGHQAKVPAV